MTEGGAFEIKASPPTSGTLVSCGYTLLYPGTHPLRWLVSLDPHPSVTP